MTTKETVERVADLRPQVTDAAVGAEPSWRYLVRFFYAQHGLENPDEAAERYFATLAAMPSPDGQEAMREACAALADSRANGFVSAARRSDMSYGRRIEAEYLRDAIRALPLPRAPEANHG